MSAYIIARVEVTDMDQYRKYTEVTPGLVAEFGGRFVVRGGETVTLEGAPRGSARGGPRVPHPRGGPGLLRLPGLRARQGASQGGGHAPEGIVDLVGRKRDLPAELRAPVVRSPVVVRPRRVDHAVFHVMAHWAETSTNCASPVERTRACARSAATAASAPAWRQTWGTVTRTGARSGTPCSATGPPSAAMVRSLAGNSA